MKANLGIKTSGLGPIYQFAVSQPDRAKVADTHLSRVM